ARCRAPCRMKRLLPRCGVLLGSLALLTSLFAQSDSPATPEAKLQSLGLTLPATSAPVANYVPAVRSGSLIILAGQIPRGPDGGVITGQVGRDATTEEAHAAARQAALALLAALKTEIGELTRVKRIVRVGGYVNATRDFTAH